MKLLIADSLLFENQHVVMLSGSIEVGTADNQKRRSSAGQAFSANDLTSKGHVTRVVNGPARMMFAQLPDGFRFRPLVSAIW